MTTISACITVKGDHRDTPETQLVVNPDSSIQVLGAMYPQDMILFAEISRVIAEHRRKYFPKQQKEAGNVR